MPLDYPIDWMRLQSLYRTLDCSWVLARSSVSDVPVVQKRTMTDTKEMPLEKIKQKNKRIRKKKTHSIEDAISSIGKRSLDIPV